MPFHEKPHIGDIEQSLTKSEEDGDHEGSVSEKSAENGKETSGTWLFAVHKAGWTFTLDGENAFDRLEDARVAHKEYDLGAMFQESPASAVRMESQKLLQQIQEMKKSTEETLDKKKCRIIFVTDDIGGIVVKEALLIASKFSEYEYIATDARLLVFFGTPHRLASSQRCDTVLSNILLASENESKFLLPSTLELFSKYFFALSSAFYSIQGRYNIVNFYQTRHGSGDYPIIVERWEATLETIREELVGRPTSHSDLSRFSQNTLWDFLQEKFRAASPDDNDNSPWKGSNSTYIDIYNYLLNRKSLQQKSVQEISQTRRDTTLSRKMIAWISSHEKFCAWIKDDSSIFFLVLRGVEGLDKPSLYETVKSSHWFGSNSPVVISFTFEEDNQQNNNVTQLSVSLIKQLLEEIPLGPQVPAFYDTHIAYSAWTEPQLWDVLRCLISSSVGRPMICIINNFHECNSSDIWFLRDLTLLREGMELGFKIIVTLDGNLNPETDLGTRYYQIDLDDFLSKDESKILNPSVVEKIMLENSSVKVLKYEVCEGIYSATTKSLLGSITLVNYLEAGAFQWLRNQQELFSSTEPTEVVEKILGGVPIESWSWARKVLMWITCACRPLKLNELFTALKIGDHWEPHATLNEYASKENISQQIIDKLNESLLVVVKIEEDSAHLIDGCVRDVLRRAAMWDWYAIDGTAHWELCLNCLSYLSMEQIQDAATYLQYDWNGGNFLQLQGFEQLFFLEYAVKYWPAHYIKSVEHRPAGLESSPDDDFVLAFLKKPETVQMWAELYWYLEDPICKQHHGSPTLNPLHISCRFGFTKIVERLTSKQSAGSEISDEEFDLALRIASRNGRADIVAHLIEIGQPHFLKIEPALLEAAEAGHGNVALELLSRVEKPSGIQNLSRLICLSTQNGHIEIIKYLLDTLKVDRAMASNHGDFTYVHYAASQGHVSIIEALGKGSVSEMDNWQHFVTPLQLATGKGYLEVVTMLLNFGVLNAASSPDSPTPLHLAAEKGYHTIVEKLLENGASVDDKDDQGRTPLHISCSKGFIRISEMLLAKDAQPNIQDGRNNTPLHFTAKKTQTPLIRLLLQKGAQVKVQNFGGDTPLHIALRGPHEEAASLLVEKFGIAKANLEESKDLTDDKGANYGSAESVPGNSKGLSDGEGAKAGTSSESGFNVVNINGEIPLIMALENDLSKVALMILCAPKRYAGKVPQSTRRKALTKAAEKGFVEFVKVLLETEPGQMVKVKQLRRYGSKIASPEIREFKGPRYFPDPRGLRENPYLRLSPYIPEFPDVRDPRDSHYPGEPRHVPYIEAYGDPREPRYPGEPRRAPSYIETFRVPREPRYPVETRHPRATRELLYLPPERLLSSPRQVTVQPPPLRPRSDIGRISHTVDALEMATISRDSVPNLLQYPPESPMSISRRVGFSRSRSRSRSRSHSRSRSRSSSRSSSSGTYRSQRRRARRTSHREYRNRPESAVVGPHKVESPGARYISDDSDTNPSSSEIYRTRHRHRLSISERDHRYRTTLPEIPYLPARRLINLGTSRSITMGSSISEPSSSEEDENAENAKIPLEVIFSALNLAASNGHVEVVDEILRARPKVRTKSKWFVEPLTTAVKNGHKDVVKHLIVAAASDKQKDVLEQELGNSLRSAAKFGHDQVVRVLLDHGVDINGQDKNRNTALQLAAYFRKANIVRLLLLRKANLNLEDDRKSNAISDAAYRNSKEALELLLEAGAKTEVRNENGETPLMRAVQRGHAEIIEILLQAEADINAQDIKGETPLLRAAQLNNREADKLILRAGAHQNAKSVNTKSIPEVGNSHDWDRALVREIITNANEEIVGLLIDNGANINTVDAASDWHAAPLHSASSAGKIKIVKLLLDRGADRDFAMSRFGTPLQTAAASVESAVVDLLLTYNADVNKTGGIFSTALQAAAYFESSGRITQSLLNAGAITNFTGGRFGTPLHAAVANASILIAKMLLDNGSSERMKTDADAQSRLPLHLAAQSDSWELVGLVRPTGSDSDFDCLDSQHRTPLHFAAAKGAVSVIKKLKEIFQRESKPFYDLTDVDGWTPLHWAFRQRSLEAVRLLISNEADLDQKSARGWTPRHVAVFHGNQSMINIILLDLRTPEHISTPNIRDLGDVINKSIVRDSHEEVNKETKSEGEEEKQTKTTNEVDQSTMVGSQEEDKQEEEMVEGEEEKPTATIDIVLPLQEGKWHVGYECDSCGCHIYGNRYHCKTCIDWDYCFKCHWTADKTHYPDEPHGFVVIEP